MSTHSIETSSPSVPGFRSLLILAWPVVLARSSQAVIGFCDAIMSSSLGQDELAAVTTGAMNTFAFTILPMGLVFIGQSFSSQLFGQENPKAAVRYAWYGLIISAFVGLLSLSMIPFVGSVLSAFDYSPAVHGHMSDYMEIRILSVAAVLGTEALGNWYGGLGNTKIHMAAGLVAMACNIFLNWVFIFGNLGAPAMGVEGAAAASVISAWIGFSVVAFYFAAKRGIPVDSIRPCGLKLRELARMVRFGFPHGLNWFFEFAAFIVFINIVVADLGTAVLAAMMVVFNINSVSFMPSFGLSTAGAILTGQAIGKGEKEQVTAIVKKTLVLALLWQCTIGALYLVMPRTLMAWFSDPADLDSRFLEIGATLLAISAAWQLFDAMAITFGETLRSAGDTAWALWARIAIAWVFFLPAGFLVVRVLDGGYVGAILCVVGYLVLLGIVLMIRFRSGAWKRIDLTGPIGSETTM